MQMHTNARDNGADSWTMEEICNGFHVYQMKIYKYVGESTNYPTRLLSETTMNIHSGKAPTKELPDPGCTHSDKHLVKFRSRGKEEWYLSLTSDGLG